MQEISQRCSRTQIKQETLTHIFYDQRTVKYTTKQSRMYHESYRKISRKLQENYSMPGVQIARIRVHIARKIQETERKPKPAGKKPKPTLHGGSGSPECLRGVGLIRIH